MANNATNYLEGAVAQHFLRTGAAVTQPTSLSLALFTSDPTETGAAGTEVTGGAYARQPITFTAGTSPGTASRYQNSAQITFATATANWGTVTNFVVFDNAGNPLLYGPLTASKVINTGDQFIITTGSFTVDID